MKKIIPVICFICCLQSLFAQQDPEYTQYMYNLSVVNPAYATQTPAILNLGALYRSQWAGIVGAPKTFTFFAHTPFTEKVEGGISVVSDDIGDGALKENNIYADFAYVLQLSDNSHLSLGLKGGVTLLNTDFSNFQLGSGNSQTDPAYAENINSAFPNIGVGAFYFTDNYYLGISTPNLLSSTHVEEKNGVNNYGNEALHLYLTGGYVLDINADMKLKPSFMMKAVKGAPLSVDLSANMLFYNRFEAGVSYRFGDSFSGMFNVKVTPNFRIGYAYDYTLSNLGSFNSGSHEVFALFDLDFLNISKGYDKSPRFF
ncbi:type IX secretion system membrane protein PorP/SprF [Zhouia sp. PK063]|uniref:type IX secretion system membrane protein PorP/SprF n=1 Tax=Zhouia sp. PK063 TaxID=3373602 RepID=UPI0037913784